MSRATRRARELRDVISWRRGSSREAVDCFVTCSGKSDGAGAQIQAVLSTMLFANEYGIRYVHTPFKSIEHSIGDEEIFRRRWEAFVNLGSNELHVDGLDLNELEVVYVSHPREIKKRNRTLFVISHCHGYADLFPDLYLRMQDEFRRKFHSSTEAVKSYFDDSSLNVAVHVRRGDIACQDRSRYISSSLVSRSVEAITSATNALGVEPVFHIYSEGRVEEFSDFDHEGVIFHLNECPFEAFSHMVSADVLVMAKSSFSYSAALFSKGIVVYSRFRHQPLKNWVVLNSKGSFDIREFRDLIERRRDGDISAIA